MTLNMIDFQYRPFKAIDLIADSLFTFDESVEPELFYKFFFPLGSTRCFSTFSEIANYDGDLVALVPFEHAINMLHASRAEFCRILELWQPPTAAVACLMLVGGHRGGFSHMQSDNHLYIWYEIATSHARNEIGAISVIQIVNTRTQTSRTLALYPTVLKASMIEMSDRYFGRPDQVHWSMIDFLMAELAMKTWRWRAGELLKDGYQSILALEESINKVLDTQVINRASLVALDIRKSLNNLDSHRELVCNIQVYADKHTEHMAETIASWAGMTTNNLQNIVGLLTALRQTIEEKRAMSTVSINVLSTSYLYRNMIALRRIAEQNQTEMRSTQKQAEAAQASAKSMAKIAYVGMLYLPATSLAAIFAMPFFTLENVQDLGNMNELSVYVLVVLTSTLLTFVLPMVLPKAWQSLRSYMHHPLIPEDGQVEVQEAVEDPALEPPPYKFPADALQQEIDRLFRVPDKSDQNFSSELGLQSAEDSAGSEQDIADEARHLDTEGDFGVGEGIAEQRE